MSLTKSAHSLRSFALTARFARSTGLSALRAIEHYRGRVLNHGRACQRCDNKRRLFSVHFIVGAYETINERINSVSSPCRNKFLTLNVEFDCDFYNYFTNNFILLFTCLLMKEQTGANSSIGAVP